jgi:hypothetical protein
MPKHSYQANTIRLFERMRVSGELCGGGGAICLCFVRFARHAAFDAWTPMPANKSFNGRPIVRRRRLLHPIWLDPVQVFEKVRARGKC